MRVMGVAYELVRAAFAYRGVKVDDNTIADKVIANKIVELAEAGERNPDLLCEAIKGYSPGKLACAPGANVHITRLCPADVPTKTRNLAAARRYPSPPYIAWHSLSSV
jgi:hypothetical protein